MLSWTRVAILFLFVSSAWSSSGHCRSILVVAPHPDDESLTAAGVIRSAVLGGDAVQVVVMSTGDFKGKTIGLERLPETVAAMKLLGLDESQVIFLGYGDGTLMRVHDSPGADDIIRSHTHQVRTYANRGLGGTDYHTYRFGKPGDYNRRSVLQDLETIIDDQRPDDIYTVSSFDEHPDHSATNLFVVEAIGRITAKDHSYGVKLHATIVHAPGEDAVWPGRRFEIDRPYPKPRFVDSSPLRWEDIEKIPVPREMRLRDPSRNLKHRALDQYATQKWPWNNAFCKLYEFFWVTRYGAS